MYTATALGSWNRIQVDSSAFLTMARYVLLQLVDHVDQCRRPCLGSRGHSLLLLEVLHGFHLGIQFLDHLLLDFHSQGDLHR